MSNFQIAEMKQLKRSKTTPVLTGIPRHEQHESSTPPAPLTLFVLHAAKMDYIRLIQAKFPSSFILFSDLNLSFNEMLVRMTITNNGVDTKQNNKHGKKDNKPHVITRKAAKESKKKMQTPFKINLQYRYRFL